MYPLTELSIHMTKSTKVLLVMDVVESVRIMEEDQDDFVRRWQQLVRQAEQQILPQHGGRIVKSLGDGLMLEFASAQGGVKAAFALQHFSQQGNARLTPPRQMHLRIGGHLASFVADQHDIYGTDVNLTARLCTLAGPNEIVISAELRDQLVPMLDADVDDMGECYLKHIERPVRAYRIAPPGGHPLVDTGNAVRLDLRPAIAVIPFAMRSAEAGHEMLGEALADEVIAALSRTSELHVISRLSTTVFRERHEAVDNIRSHLGASYILSGTCRSMGSQIALFVELIDAKTGHVVWAENLKSEVHGLFATDDELIGRLVAAVSSSVMSQELERVRGQALPTLEGYTLLLGAVALMHRTAFSEFDRARQMLEHLIDRSRRHPVPHAWLAKWHVLRVQQGWSEDPAREAMQALDCAKRALDHDPHCALALTVDGFAHTNLLRKLDVGAQRYDQALSINPNDSLACLLKGTLHAFKGEGALAMAQTEKALALSPLDPLRYFYDSLAATAALSASEFARASELAQRSRRANRTHTSTLRALIIAEVELDRLESAQSAMRELLQLDPSFTVSGFLSRSPSNQSAFGLRCAQAFRMAGVPEH
jgi:TolB-like protein/class 3 adenylate cyclase/Tfp pilus assembly protein PilF